MQLAPPEEPASVKTPAIGCGQRLSLVPLVVLLFVGISGASFAYNEDGHFYTAAGIERSRQLKDPDFTEARLVTFCAQMPDLTNQLDAVTLRVNEVPSLYGSLWGAFSRCWGEGVRHMVTVHQYLHGFVDAAQMDPPAKQHPSQAVTKAAVALIANFHERMVKHPDSSNHLTDACALGFAIHLLGDSFAHRTITNTDIMYDPGMGHFDDGHHPDYIEYHDDYGDRRSLWVDYTATLAQALEGSDYQSQYNQDYWQGIADKYVGGSEDDRFHSPGILKELAGTFPDQSSNWRFDNPAFEHFLDKYGCLGGYILCGSASFKNVFANYKDAFANYWSKVSQLKYEAVWKAYRDQAVTEFRKAGIRRTCDLDDIQPQE